MDPSLSEVVYSLAEICRSGQLLGKLDSPASAFYFLFPFLDFIGVFIFDTDLLLEIILDELEFFSAGLEKHFIEFHNRRAHAQRLEHIPQSDSFHIDHRG